MITISINTVYPTEIQAILDALTEPVDVVCECLGAIDDHSIFLHDKVNSIDCKGDVDMELTDKRGAVARLIDLTRVL